MLTWSNTDSAGASRSVAAGPLYIQGNTYGEVTWIATAQDLNTGTNGGTSSLLQEAQRTDRTCYMKGLSEHIRLQTSSGVPWFHRRICFTYKGPDPFQLNSSSDTPVQTFPSFYLDTSAGMQRLWFNSTINAQPNTTNNRRAILFKGAEGVDWTDALTAPVDTSRVSIKFDKTWTYKSGNNNGIVREHKLWHPMNHNLVYGDDESGAGMSTSYVSVDSKPGMGDYYVWDYFTPGAGGTVNDLIRIESNSTLYWHEK